MDKATRIPESSLKSWRYVQAGPDVDGGRHTQVGCHSMNSDPMKKPSRTEGRRESRLVAHYRKPHPLSRSTLLGSRLAGRRPTLDAWLEPTTRTGAQHRRTPGAACQRKANTQHREEWGTNRQQQVNACVALLATTEAWSSLHAEHIGKHRLLQIKRKMS
jgi:hypothetical protein